MMYILNNIKKISKFFRWSKVLNFLPWSVRSRRPDLRSGSKFSIRGPRKIRSQECQNSERSKNRYFISFSEKIDVDVNLREIWSKKK